MPDRTAPYGNFNFLVTIDGVSSPEEPLGGFSDVSGLTTEQTVAEYRNGNFKENHVIKVPGVFKVSDITLKRGLVDSTLVWAWISDSRQTGVKAKKTVKITLLDESRTPIVSWNLRGVTPLKYTGPTLNAKGGTDVAMEELVLSAENLEVTAGG